MKTNEPGETLVSSEPNKPSKASEPCDDSDGSDNSETSHPECLSWKKVVRGNVMSFCQRKKANVKCKIW